MQETGLAVLAAHVDRKGEEGVFHDLRRMEPGDEVMVERTDGVTARFAVRRVEQYAKETFPSDEVYGDVDTAQLRLITCGGEFDGAAGSYRDNIDVALSPDLVPDQDIVSQGGRRVVKKTRYTCGLDAAIDVMGGKWKVLILWVLHADGTLRFGVLRREVAGISERILAAQLRELENAGLVHREIYHQVPPKVEYSLTPLGSSLVTALIPLGAWGEEHMATIESIPRD